MGTFFKIIGAFFYIVFMLNTEIYSVQKSPKCPLTEKLLMHTADRTADTVFVAPPTGDRDIDRASIQVALQKVEPGGTIQFSAGTYLMGGQIFKVTKPKITLLGHPDGTTLKGCNSEEFPMENSTEFGNNCNGLELIAGEQTIRNITFEHFFWALHIGCCWESRPGFMPGAGGQLIEGNTFRSNRNAIRIHGYWTEPTIIRKNKLMNNWHTITIYGNTAHILNNIISAPDPEEVQMLGFPGDGIHIGHPMELHEDAKGVKRTCENNIVSGNHIDGVTEGIMLSGGDPEIICRNNIIRNNTIIIRRTRPIAIPDFIKVNDKSDSTVVGIPLALRGYLEKNLIDNNIIQGAEGLAIEVRGASNNRIINNMISGVTRRKPFPGNAITALPMIGGDPGTWREANGAGIWISPGSNGNEIRDNDFEDIASSAVFIEGDNNVVEVQRAEDTVGDLGTGNQINTEKDSINPLYESKFVETRGIRLQYMDFGGSGLPVIFLQDYHDYFSIVEEEPGHAAWLARFADDFRVFAPVRRGYGKSDDTGYGYDVATQAEDLLGLMDALDIEKAVLIGRIPANQDMTWIAEHHPERVAGLVYIGNPRISAFQTDPDAIAFDENYVRGVCDTDTDEAEKWEQRTGARQTWRPHFFTDSEASIDIPTLRFYNPMWEGTSLNLMRLGPERIKELVLSDHCGDEQAQKYFSELAADEERLQKLRQVFKETDPSRKLNETMERAFGSSMKTVVEEGLIGADAMYDFHFPHMIKFLQRIEQKEK